MKKHWQIKPWVFIVIIAIVLGALVYVFAGEFFVNYSSGPDIDSVSDHNPKEQRESASELDIGFVQPRHPCIFPGEIVPPINVGEASVPENSQ